MACEGQAAGLAQGPREGHNSGISGDYSIGGRTEPVRVNRKYLRCITDIGSELPQCGAAWGSSFGSRPRYTVNGRSVSVESLAAGLAG